MHQAAVTRTAGFVGKSVLCKGDREQSILAQVEPEADAPTLREDLADSPIKRFERCYPERSTLLHPSVDEVTGRSRLCALCAFA